jgi:hypothetical protein
MKLGRLKMILLLFSIPMCVGWSAAQSDTSLIFWENGPLQFDNLPLSKSKYKSGKFFIKPALYKGKNRTINTGESFVNYDYHPVVNKKLSWKGLDSFTPSNQRELAIEQLYFDCNELWLRKFNAQTIVNPEGKNKNLNYNVFVDSVKLELKSIKEIVSSLPLQKIDSIHQVYVKKIDESPAPQLPQVKSGKLELWSGISLGKQWNSGFDYRYGNAPFSVNYDCLAIRVGRIGFMINALLDNRVNYVSTCIIPVALRYGRWQIEPYAGLAMGLAEVPNIGATGIESKWLSIEGKGNALGCHVRYRIRKWYRLNYNPNMMRKPVLDFHWVFTVCRNQFSYEENKMNTFFIGSGVSVAISRLLFR